MPTEEEKKRKSEYQKQYRELNRDILNQKKREHYIKNKDLISQRTKEKREANWEEHREKEKANYYKNREKRLVEMKNFRDNNAQYFIDYREKNKEKISKRVKKWCQENRDKRQAYWNSYRSSKLNATPKWLTEEDHRDIFRFYKVASYLTKHTKTKYSVDHIIPLQGEYTSGLNVPWNLQILTSWENSKKGNSVLPEHCQFVEIS